MKKAVWTSIISHSKYSSILKTHILKLDKTQSCFLQLLSAVCITAVLWDRNHSTVGPDKAQKKIHFWLQKVYCIKSGSYKICSQYFFIDMKSKCAALFKTSWINCEKLLLPFSSGWFCTSCTNKWLCFELLMAIPLYSLLFTIHCLHRHCSKLSENVA